MYIRYVYMYYLSLLFLVLAVVRIAWVGRLCVSLIEFVIA